MVARYIRIYIPEDVPATEEMVETLLLNFIKQYNMPHYLWRRQPGRHVGPALASSFILSREHPQVMYILSLGDELQMDSLHTVDYICENNDTMRPVEMCSEEELGIYEACMSAPICLYLHSSDYLLPFFHKMRREVGEIQISPNSLYIAEYHHTTLYTLIVRSKADKKVYGMRYTSDRHPTELHYAYLEGMKDTEMGRWVPHVVTPNNIDADLVEQPELVEESSLYVRTCNPEDIWKLEMPLDVMHRFMKILETGNQPHAPIRARCSNGQQSAHRPVYFERITPFNTIIVFTPNDLMCYIRELVMNKYEHTYTYWKQERDGHSLVEFIDDEGLVTLVHVNDERVHFNIKHLLLTSAVYDAVRERTSLRIDEGDELWNTM